ncbi:Cas10/Cmr2 second palm domain-containing protein [Alienimonas californiensis]|uniref:CRISPR-associated protein n=1 Tax=Alienimonas californiensis TaxID=2527989 RepID=A0A517P6P1_9PLAN|nr:type III-B CRISPR-associated protein Cas10/Cmr2 [Alienimonas californiensis]QDT15046.1 CRISPR-associated protein [Alienimonas californiensis]
MRNPPRRKAGVSPRTEVDPLPVLAQFAVSPVQRFIREARKSQDIWSGSLVLSHLTLALCDAARERGGEILFPAGAFEDSAPKHPHRPRVTNEVTARFDDNAPTTVVAFCEDVAGAGRAWWLDAGEKVRNGLLSAGLFREGELEKWSEQLKSRFTIGWSWAAVGEGGDAAALHALHRYAAAAKAARRPAVYRGDDRPKCTLCGEFEQMGEPGKTVKEATAFWTATVWGEIGTGEASRVIRARLDPNGRERLCAVCLTKRFAPVWAIAPKFKKAAEDRDDAAEARRWDHTKEESYLRFPSTHSVALAAAKRRVAEAAAKGTDEAEKLRQALDRFVAAVDARRAITGEPLGRHVSPWHADVPGADADGPARRFLRLDGGWLFPDRWDGAGDDDPGGLLKTLDGLRHAAKAAGAPLGDCPPVALIRADADKMGERLEREAREGGVERARELSRVLAENVLAEDGLIRALETDHLGAVLFAGGDELIAMVPVEQALPAAAAIAEAYEKRAAEAGSQERRGFPDVTGSVGVTTVSVSHPLRMAIEGVGDLLERAKNHRRPAVGAERGDAEGLRDRRALGLAVIPGSGNVREGRVGLSVAAAGGEPRRVIGDLLAPLALAMTESGVALELRPKGDGPTRPVTARVSPKLFREWVALLAPVAPRGRAKFDKIAPHFLPAESSAVGGRDGGYALAEFARLAERHLASIDPPPSPKDRADMSRAVARTLADELRPLLPADPAVATGADWDNLTGLLACVVTLGTRTLRGADDR